MNTFQGIENIIFDLGDVIIDLDRDRALNEFDNLGVKNIDTLYSEVIQSDFVIAFERGEISSTNFRNGLRPYFSKPISDAEIDHAWNAILIDIPVERIAVLKELKKKYRLFILSNTNVIHIDAIRKHLHDYHSLDDFSSIFEKTYFSYDLNLRKPELEIYQAVLEERSLNPPTTLFVDDRHENILAAEELGIQACLITKTRTMLDIFDI